MADMNRQGVSIVRVFDAPRELVWRAWTEPELMKTWWGPTGFTCPVAKIDFRVGGKYLMAMHGPAGTEFDKDFWSAGVYHEIVPTERIVLTDTFSDENGNVVDPAAYGEDPDFPKESVVTLLFEDQDGRTKLTIQYPYPGSDAAYEAMAKSGMTEGWNQSLDKLGESLKARVETSRM
jgi:uncharacterized protein YndB with AHSA1/START domain